MAVDLETLVAQVWSPDVRPLAEEAWRCYNAGAIRASIAATWSAVTADIIVKLIRLADEGDKGAQAFRQQVTDAQDKGLTPEGVRAMQAIEASLVDKAVDFELIDTIGKRELDRIREDRHLCSHPSLRMEGEVYNPRPEAARGHLAIALSTLLVHPPTQAASWWRSSRTSSATRCSPPPQRTFVPPSTTASGSPPAGASSRSPRWRRCSSSTRTAGCRRTRTPTGWRSRCAPSPK
ncbi:hypothetical protein ACIA5G_39060 [Amycolatopsis sp. NPDC051758]|uniref:hypothetical protein n=1 Tax=Amycolatopsis sp. NPDC051758 TaxID=3363935 RepID=UPI0037BC4A44